MACRGSDCRNLPWSSLGIADRLDIRRATALPAAEREGIEPEQDWRLCPLCTVAEPLMFHSWRRDQVKAVQWSGVVSQA
jgi:copper oxidase (laccase) domain-containing protein